MFPGAGAVFPGAALGAFVSGGLGCVGDVFCGVVSGVGLVGAVSVVGLVGVVSGVGVVGAEAPGVGAAVPGAGAAVPGAGAAVPGAGAAVPDGDWEGAVLCPAAPAEGAAVWLKLWTVKNVKNAAVSNTVVNFALEVMFFLSECRIPFFMVVVRPFTNLGRERDVRNQVEDLSCRPASGTAFFHSVGRIALREKL